ncbi:MAG: exosome complex exonuclease Rrp41, partial [Thermoproteota archaeon]|nr:exosome complex exonuclease Rrp41 [Thermoproteota archaeon]
MTQIRSLIDENGKRTDGRGIDELRPVKITVGTVKNADGSAFIEFGKNKILAAV